jgi:hypothetical protein
MLTATALFGSKSNVLLGQATLYGLLPHISAPIVFTFHPFFLGFFMYFTAMPRGTPTRDRDEDVSPLDASSDEGCPPLGESSESSDSGGSRPRQRKKVTVSLCFFFSLSLSLFSLSSQRGTKTRGSSTRNCDSDEGIPALLTASDTDTSDSEHPKYQPRRRKKVIFSLCNSLFFFCLFLFSLSLSLPLPISASHYHPSPAGQEEVAPAAASSAQRVAVGH